MNILKAKIRDIVSIVVFLGLITASVFFVQPVFTRLSSEVSSYAQNLKNQLENELSIRISYKSLSPSILSSVNLKDVSLTTMEGEEVAVVSRIKLEYRFIPLIKGDLVNGVKSLLIEGLDMDGAKLLSLIGNNASLEDENTPKKQETGIQDVNWKQIAENLSAFKATIPVNVVFKNMNFTFSNADVDLLARANVRKMTIDYVARSNQISFDADIQASAIYKDKEYSGSLDADGKLFDGFENSSINLSLSSLTDGNVRLNKINLLAGYSNSVFTISTIKNTIPLALSGMFNLSEEKAQVSVKADDLSLGNLVHFRKQNDLLKKYNKFRLTTDSTAFFERNRNAPASRQNLISYTSNTSSYIPENLFPKGLQLQVALKGDTRKVSFSSLKVENPDYLLSGNLDLFFKELNASGYLNAEKVILPGGTFINGEIYLDPLEKGFLAFIPQVFIDENVFTAVQLNVVPQQDSIDFAFEGYDYSHMDADDPGKISGDGSYLLDEKYIQSSLSINSFFVDTVLKTAASFLPEENRSSLTNMTDTVKDYIFSGESYISTDMKSFSFNVPYVLLANTVQENQALYLALDGNGQDISVTQADLVLGKYAFHASGTMEMVPETKENFIMLDLSAGDIPYHFAGTLSGNAVSLAGDYGSEINIDFSDAARLTGNLSWFNFPVSVQNFSVFSTMNSSFSYSGEDGIVVNVNNLELEEGGTLVDFKPRLSLSGFVNQYGAKMNRVTYSDLYSSLDGTADFVLSMDDGIPVFANAVLAVKNPLSEESVSLTASMTNPENIPLSSESLMQSYNLDVSAIVKRFGMNRFSKVKSNNNELSFSVTASGTVENPYVSASIDNLALMNSGNLMKMNGSAVLEDKVVTIHDFKYNFVDMDINQVYGHISLRDFTGLINANVDGLFIGESYHLPLEIEIKDVIKKENSFLPEDMTVVASSKDIYGSLFKKKLNLTLTGNISKNAVTVVSSENFGLFAYYTTDGDFMADWNCEGIVKVHLDGNYSKGSSDFHAKLSQVDVQMKEFFEVINFDSMVKVYSGELTGIVELSGSPESPTVNGQMILQSPTINIPVVMKEKLYTDNLILNFITGEIFIPEKKFEVKKNSEVFASCRIIFDNWKYDHLEAHVKANKGRFVPVYITDAAKKMVITGEGNMDLNMVLTVDEFDLQGVVFAEKAELFLNLAKLLTATPAAPGKIAMSMALNVNLGTHVRVAVDPLLRAIFVPGQRLKVGLDGSTGALTLDGNLTLKSGDVSYLNRNFYIKQGSLKFSESDEGFNPLVNVVAETRERDEKGDQVTISLNGINQYFSSFTPKFSSVPAKSEVEIQQLMGQIAVADSESVGNFLFAAGDYALQSLVGRKFENTLRDFFNFDIFSLRTNIIQNTLNLSFSQNGSSENFSAGNFFDNSTVYIGKYLGSALYIDAMLNLQYDEKRVRDTVSLGGIMFQPEFGMELESPFGNIRWNVAPDIDALLHKQYVPSSSVSLSWKFSL